MKKRFVITNTGVRLPLTQTVLYAFLLYYFKAPEWLWGVFATVYAIIWILLLIATGYEERVDLFSDKPKDVKIISKFQERLQELINKK